MFHGVAREKGRGVPACVHQKKETTKTAIAKARWTLKVATLKNDEEIKGLVAVSLYDSKPFYFLTNACEEIKWQKQVRKVWHKDLKKMVDMPFNRLNIIDNYNNHMNDVDMADQVRNVYRWDLFMRKRKWWWSMMMWCLQVLQANSYVLYKKYMIMHRLDPMSHYDFNKSIALAWIDQDTYWPKKKRSYQASNQSVTSTSVTLRSNESTCTIIKRAPRFTDQSLCPINGSLNHRLEEHRSHWPLVNLKKNASCQLHRWATDSKKKKKRANLVTCSHCKVTLCVACFVPYHTVPHLGNMKRSLAIDNDNEESTNIEEV